MYVDTQNFDLFLNKMVSFIFLSKMFYSPLHYLAGVMA